MATLGRWEHPTVQRTQPRTTRGSTRGTRSHPRRDARGGRSPRNGVEERQFQNMDGRKPNGLCRYVRTLVRLVSETRTHLGKVGRGGQKVEHARGRWQGGLHDRSGTVPGGKGHGLPYPPLVRKRQGNHPRLQNGPHRPGHGRFCKTQTGNERQIQGLGKGCHSPRRFRQRHRKQAQAIFAEPTGTPLVPGQWSPDGQPCPR
mmetsp:Transcript_16596/g.36152  ORF Transcript_16596/g.36152 Transcript_16596/m.36152 type:complete len:202 (-) Transcript_16596:782-1387(-)